MSGKMIYKQMSLIMSEVEPIAKGRSNTSQGYKFRGIDDVYQALQLIMAKHGVLCIPTVLSDRSEERLSSAGKALIYRILTIKYTFYAEDGSSIESVVIGEGMDSGDKASNKALSVGQKYALLQAFCIPTDDPKDPENPSVQDQDGGVAPRQQSQQKPKTTQAPKAPTPNDKLISNAGAVLGFSRDQLLNMLDVAKGSAPDGVYDDTKNGHKRLLGALCQLEDVREQAAMGSISAFAMSKQCPLEHLDTFVHAAVKEGAHRS